MWGVYRVDVEREIEQGRQGDLPLARKEVIPMFGPDHERGDACWCGPWRDPGHPTLRVHRAPPS